MKNTAFLWVLFAVMSLTSCSKDQVTDNSSNNQWNGASTDFTQESEYNFPNSAVRDVQPFIDNLLVLNDKIDKTTLYSDSEFNGLYKKKISVPLQSSGISIEDYTASSPDLNASLKSAAKTKFILSVNSLIKLRGDLTKNSGKRATKGNAGFVGSDDMGGVIRYVNEKGIELAEATEKQIMGVILLDQIINHHLSDAIMKDKTLRTSNDQRKFISQKSYTELEYHWDFAYMLLGRENRDNTPKFIANYIINEYQGADFIQNIDVVVFKAFSQGRKALSESDYTTVEKNIGIIRDAISKLFAARVIHYLKKAEPNLKKAETSLEYAEGIHNLSEVYGFIPALVSTRKQNGDFYFTDYDVINKLVSDLEGNSGFWDKERLTSDENTTGSLKNIAKRVGEIYGMDYTKIK